MRQFKDKVGRTIISEEVGKNVQYYTKGSKIKNLVKSETFELLIKKLGLTESTQS